MRFLTNLACLVIGLLGAGGIAIAAAAGPAGTLELSLVGNGRICARMHEDIVVARMTEKQAWKMRYTTYAYRFRLFAVHGDTGKEVVLFDSKVRRTSARRKVPVSNPSRNPLPHSARTEEVREERDFWVKQVACRSFARRSEFPLKSGTYSLRVFYQVQSPNGSWYVEIDDTGPDWDIRPGQTTSQRFLLLDDGNRREIGFLQRPAPPPVPAGADGEEE